MKIEVFSTLEAVIRAGSFASAAVQSNLTPSAVSMQMKQVERYLGITLFDRSGLQARPLPAAIEVAEAMREGLSRVESLRRHPSRAIEGTVRLGIIESLMPSLLPQVMSRLRAGHPALRILPTRGRSSFLTQAVKAGRLDAAVVAQPPGGGSERLRWQLLGRRELVLIASPDADESSPREALRQHPWIRYDRDTVTGAMAARHVLSLVPGKRVALELDSAPTIVSMVFQGLGVSIIGVLDDSWFQIHPVRVYRLGRGAPVLRLAMVSRKTDDDDRALTVVGDALSLSLRKS